MGALQPTRPTAPGVLAAPANVSASDTIDAGLLGTLGCYLKIINGAGVANNVTISDGGVTPANNAAAPAAVPVAAGTAKWFYISPRQVNLANSLVTVANSAPTTNTYELLPIG